VPNAATVDEVRISEAYRNYTPPLDASAIVRKLLRTVPKKYLQGLDCVVLTNGSALSRKDRVGRVWSRKRKFDKTRVLGLYHHGTRNSLPWIELRVDKIVAAFTEAPFFFRVISLLREIVFGHVLFHELGHHIHRTIRPEHIEKEDVADKWAGKLNASFILQTYLHAVPVLKAYNFMRKKQWI